MTESQDTEAASTEWLEKQVSDHLGADRGSDPCEECGSEAAAVTVVLGSASYEGGKWCLSIDIDDISPRCGECGHSLD